jgi:23S rRNA U2552 (ribose-2'-O)-methylase RlmE/FtsJ
MIYLNFESFIKKIHNMPPKSIIYNIKANELDQKFLEKLKTIYQEREIQITISDITSELSAMANDPNIQAEIKKIEQEFKITEIDGLTNL